MPTKPNATRTTASFPMQPRPKTSSKGRGGAPSKPKEAKRPANKEARTASSHKAAQALLAGVLQGVGARQADPKLVAAGEHLGLKAGAKPKPQALPFLSAEQHRQAAEDERAWAAQADPQEAERLNNLANYHEILAKRAPPVEPDPALIGTKH